MAHEENRRDRARPPIHPGAILREDVLPALEMSVTTAADRLGVSRQTLHSILRGDSAVSPEMALRLGKFCGNGAEIWTRMQAAYDLWHAERALADQLERIQLAEPPIAA